jgi:hypothetical protein
MRDSLRIAIIIALPIAYLAAIYAESFTLLSLAGGLKEATPITDIAFFTVFSLVLIVVVVTGNILINGYFRSKSSR